ncbi:unnamed protein product, partial [Mesorhabditis spiculigera]
MARFDLVRVVLAGLSAFLLLLSIIFIILFATKQTKSSGFITSFEGTFDSDSAASDALEKAFKDAKYTVRDIGVQRGPNGVYKGVVVLKGSQKASDVQKVSADALKNLQIGGTDSVSDVCQKSAPITPTKTPTVPTVATKTSKPQDPTTAVPVSWWCPEVGPRDYIFVVDTLAPSASADELQAKVDALRDALDNALEQDSNPQSRFALIATNGEDNETTVLYKLAPPDQTLDTARTALIALIQSANEAENYDTIRFSEVTTQIGQVGKLSSSRPVSIILIADHLGDESLKLQFSKLRQQGYFVTGVLSDLILDNYADVFSTAPVGFGESYKAFSSDHIKQAVCTVSSASAAVEEKNEVIPASDAILDDAKLAASKPFACLTHDIVLVFDETQSIYNTTEDDWKRVAYHILDQFQWYDERNPDEEDVFTRFSVVVFGGIGKGGYGGEAVRDDPDKPEDYTTEILFGLDKYTTAAGAKAQIAANVYVYNGLTNITSALRAVQKVFDDAEPYAALNRTSKRVVITMTDGYLTADDQKITKAQAKVLRDAPYQADMWFVLAENNTHNSNFPDAYKFAVEMADNKPQRVFNTSKQALADSDIGFDNNYHTQYPCPPKRCKVVYFACENTEVLDPMFNQQSNMLCVQETLLMAEYINQQIANVTYRFLLYSSKELTTLYPPQGEDDSYDNFKKQVSTLLDPAALDAKHAGFTYLANALNVIATSFRQYEKKNPLVDGALIIAGQYQKGKIEDWTLVKGAVANLHTRFTNVFVLDRSDDYHREPYNNTDFGWGVVTDQTQIDVFNGNATLDEQALEKIGAIKAINKLDCGLPPDVYCNKMMDVQFAFHFADHGDADLLADQKLVAERLVSQFRAPYPVHLGAYFLRTDIEDVELSLSTPSDIRNLIGNDSTLTAADDLNIWNDVLKERFLANAGCGHTSGQGDRPNVDNVLVIVSNDWTKWQQNTYTDVTQQLSGWTCQDCANYPKFLFVDLNPGNTTHPDGITKDGPNSNLFQISNYNFDLREPHSQINVAVTNICVPFKRFCCTDFPCNPFVGGTCQKRTFSALISSY